MQHLVRLIIILALGIGFQACASSALFQTQNEVPAADAIKSIVRVTVTSQGYYFHRPWQQRKPITQTAIGVIVPDNKILVTGMLVAGQRYIELETIDTRQKHQATVEVVDYEANLALLKPEDASFLSGRTPLSVARDAAIGETLNIWQIKPNGDTVAAAARVTSIELTQYTASNFFLAYRLDHTMQYQLNNQTLPVVRGRQLAGLVLRSNSKARTIDVIAAPVIRHFLRDAQQGRYLGFPTVGFHFGPALDPQLRRYVGLPPDLSGIYVQKVIKGGPADKAGLQSGDVVVQINGIAISNTGQYQHPQYGRTSLVHLIRTGYQVRDQVPLQVFRKGKLHTLNVTLDHRDPDEYLVPPYMIDRPPNYLIFGGLVLQELTGSYLREYGSDWTSQAPVHLLFYHQNQDYLNEDQHEKIVIISSVIPSPYSMGYENLADVIVQTVNGRKINKLADVALALQSPVNGFHKFELDQHPSVIFLDPNEIPLIHNTIQERYRIPVTPLPVLPVQ